MNVIDWVLIIPVAGALGLALLPNARLGAWLNILVSATGLAASIWLALTVLNNGTIAGALFYVDAFNVYLVVLTSLVSMTTSIFSRPYMAHELEIHKVTHLRLRLYHASFQGFMFTMLLALTTNNLGVLWIALEGATLATVLLVSLYRTRESIEAAWKYFSSAVWVSPRHCSGQYCSTLPHPV